MDMTSNNNNSEFLSYAMVSLEKMPDGVFWINQYGRVVYVNEAACKELGYSKEELLTMAVSDFDPSVSDTDDSLNLLNSIDRGEITHFKTFHRHRDGHLIPVEIVSTSMESCGEAYFSTSIVRDISERVRVESELNEAYNRLSVIYNIYQASTKERNIVLFIKETAKILQKNIEFDGLVFYLLDDHMQKIVLFHAIGLSVEITHEMLILPANFYDIDKPLTDGFPRSIKLTETTNLKVVSLLLKNEFTDLLAFPIIHKKRLIGGIGLLRKFNRPINTKDQDLLIAVCGQLSTVLQNAKLFNSLNKELEKHKRTEEMLQKANAELEKTSLTDQLTNIWNRRCFLKFAQIEIERARRNNYAISLMLLDIDHFKLVNDSYGHQTGDVVLVEFTKLLQKNIRSFDSLTRWGGEEFLILAPHLSIDNACQYAERLRYLIANHPFQQVSSITASIGVSELNNTDGLDSWIKKVDDALYRAKREGRNRVTIG